MVVRRPFYVDQILKGAKPASQRAHSRDAFPSLLFAVTTRDMARSKATLKETAMDVRGYALTISIVAGAAAWLCRHRRCPTCRTPLPSTRSLAAAAMLLTPASITGTKIALAAIPAMPRAATATGRALPRIPNSALTSKDGVSRLRRRLTSPSRSQSCKWTRRSNNSALLRRMKSAVGTSRQ